MKVEATKDAMVQAFARAIEKAGGKALLVGGLVRDEILGLPSKDWDFEVFGLPMEKIQQILSQFGNVKEVGKQFGVLNIQELDWDIALPRREQKTGEGHRGFDVVPDPTMSIEEAARRRDFTINALSKDPLTGEIIDPLNGMADLKAGILRMADPHTFGDDPLRALRGAQFAARFDMDIEPETLKVIAAQPLEELPGERILPEFSKMLLKGKKPSKGIEVLRQANLLRYFPEIEALQGVPQEPKWHPEGDVFIHTLMVIDEAAKLRTGDPEFDMPLMFGALAHDFGKPMSTEKIDGKITSRGHEEAGVEPANTFMSRMKAPLALTKQVETLVSYHLRPAILPNTGGGRKGYRKLGRELEEGGVSPDLLTAMSKADVLGRTTEAALRRDVSSQDKFLEEYHKHVTSQATGPGGKLIDSVSGKHLIDKGFKPGPNMGKFLALTRSIEDETGITDPEALIDLAARFLSDRSDGGGTQDKENQCGDSHIREGEECFDGNYRDERKRGNTKSTLASNLDWTQARPCEDGPEKYPTKCTEGPGGSVPLSTEEVLAKKKRWREVGKLMDELTDFTGGGLTPRQAQMFEELGAERDGLLLDVEKPARPELVKPNEETMSTLAPDTVATARNEMRANRDIALAMMSAVRGVAFDADTQVDTIMRGDNPNVSASELYNQFEGTRNLLRQQYGDTLTLYRAESGNQRQKPTTNWATTPEFAAQFDGPVEEKPVSVDQVAAVMVIKNGKYHELLVLDDSYSGHKEDNANSMLASNMDWAIGRPCEEGPEKYPEKCTGPGSSAENPSGPHDALDTQWELPPEDTTPYMPGDELAVPPELQEPAPPVPEPETQLGPDAWNLPFSPEELNNPKQRAAEEKMLKRTEKESAKKQNDADKAMLKKVQDEQKAQKVAEKQALIQRKAAEKAKNDAAKQAAKLSKEQANGLKKAEQEYDKYLTNTPKDQVPQGLDFEKFLEYILIGPKQDEATGTGKGPSGFRTDPDGDQADFLLWQQFDWMWKNGETTQHPGLASVTAEPQRRHRRANEYPGIKDFDRGTRFSVHPLEGPLGRDGFGGSTPHGQKENPTLPNGMTPETGIFPDKDHTFDNIEFLDWDTPPATSDIGPDHRQPFEGSPEFPKSEYPNDKGAGFLATEFPHPQLLDEALPQPSPPRSTSSEESPQSSSPGQFVRYPGGGGLDRAPMMHPRGKPQETGFLPVQNFPDPGANMFKADLDSNFDQHELKLGFQEELESDDTSSDKSAKELAKDNISSDRQHYSKKSKLSDIPNKAKMQDKVEPVEAFSPEKMHGPGGSNPGGVSMDRQRSGRGGGTKLRPHWDMDFTGKKAGFMSIDDLPTNNIFPADVDVEAARTMEDLRDIQAIFPKNFTTEWAPLQPNMGPTLRHRNERDVPPDPIKDAENYGGHMEADDDANVTQKQVQPLTPNQKMGIAVDPKGPMGERIVIMFPMFEETSPAIMSLRSHRFEKHGGVVVDGPPEWLISVVPLLEALDNQSTMDGANDLFVRVQRLLQSRGLTIEYEQEPRL